MNKRICWVNPDGTVRITEPNKKYQVEGETDTAFCERMAGLLKNALGTENCEFHIIDFGDLPKADKFESRQRNKWTFKDGKVVVKKP